MKKFFLILMAVAVLPLMQGCGDSTPEPDIVDLDKVLDAMTASMDELADTDVTELADGASKEEYDEMFISTLNRKLKSDLPGVVAVMGEDGVVRGYKDVNDDGIRSQVENDALFNVEVDSENNRLVATDTKHSYHRSSMLTNIAGGMMAGYLISSMMGRNRRAGMSSSRFNNMKMSPKGYHKGAVSKAKAANKAASSRASARSRSSSGSYKSGK